MTAQHTPGPAAETRYQRVAREQRERQEAREARRLEALKPSRKRGCSFDGPAYMHDSGPSVPREPDGYDSDNLGASPDY